jgi:hypothetical protein
MVWLRQRSRRALFGVNHELENAFRNIDYIRLCEIFKLQNRRP